MIFITNAAPRRLLACVLASCLTSLAPALADGAPVASTTSGDGTVKVNILSLNRSEGETLTLKFEVVNNGNTDYSIVVDNLTLVDLTGRRTYSAGLASTNCNTPANKRLTCWAMFASPPPATKTVAVRFYEHLDLITGVPIAE